MIVTVTFNTAVDQVMKFDEDPEPGKELRTGFQQFDSAGKGVNVTKYLTALGTDSLATGPAGGFTGGFLEEELEKAEIPAEMVRIDGTTRVNTTVLSPSGEYKFNHEGPEVGEGAVEEIREVVESHDPDTVVVSGSLPPGINAEDVDELAGDWRTVVDLHGDVLAALKERFFLCKPNREELQEATGMPTGTVEEVVYAAEELWKDGFRMVTASMGEEGAVLVTEEGRFHASTLDIEAEDTVGAGDAFLAGFLHALEEGKTREKALKWGVVVSGRKVQEPGTGAPDLEGIEDEVSRIPLQKF